MTIFLATWSVIIGLSLMLVGGLVLWAYGGRRASVLGKLTETGVEAASTRRFHQKLSRWFFVYGSTIITIGLAMLLWAAAAVFDV